MWSKWLASKSQMKNFYQKLFLLQMQKRKHEILNSVICFLLIPFFELKKHTKFKENLFQLSNSRFENVSHLATYGIIFKLKSKRK